MLSCITDPELVNTTKPHTFQLKHLSKKEFVAELYNRYGKKLYSYAIVNWKVSEDDAWDLIYKTLYKVLDSFRNYTFENEGKFASFIFRIFINYLRNHYRDHKHDDAVLQPESLDQASIQNKSENNTTSPENPNVILLNEALDEMEDWQKILLLMRSNGSPYAEIAQYISKPEEQLKVYYQRLKDQLTKKLNGKLQ